MTAEHLASRKGRCVRFAIAVLLICGAGASCGVAAAQDSVADFYRGKQLKFIIRSAPGGGYDLYSRLLGKHLVRHIPGEPTLIPQNMTGAGGIQAANFMAESAPRDGTYLSMISESLPMDQALGMTPTFKVDLRTFGWIGNLSDSNVLSYTWHTSPTRTMADAKTRETTMGSSGAGAAPSWVPILYNNVLGTRFKVINGYSGSGAIRLAMERGEIEGYGANPWAALLSANPRIVEERLVNIFVQIGVRKEKDLPDVPLLSDFATGDQSKAILDFVSKAMAVGRPIGTTPGVPPERLAALRKAFDDTLADPLFIAEAKATRTEIAPMDGVTLQGLIDDIMSTPAELRQKVKAVMPPR